MMTKLTTLRLSILLLVLFSGARSVSTQPIDAPQRKADANNVKAGASPPNATSTKSPPAASTGEDEKQPAAPTEAERIARLGRIIEADEERLAQLQAELVDPESEFQKAETEFKRWENDLEDLKAQLQQLDANQQPQQVKKLTQELADVEEKWTLAKDRFQLALEERKALQDQIAALEKKIEGDKAELAGLKGEEVPPPADQVPADEAPPDQQPPDAEREAEPTEAPLAAVDTAGEEAKQPETQQPETQQPATEVVRKAREQAEQTQQSLSEAEASVQQTRQRIAELDDLIEREEQLLETRRQREQNAWQRVAKLNQQVRQRVADGKQDELPDVTRQMEDAEAAYRSAELDVEQSRQALSRARSRREDLELQLAQAEEQVRQLHREAQRTWIKTLGLETFDWFKRHGPSLLLIVVGFFVLRHLTRIASKRIVRLLVRPGRGTTQERENRAKTLAGVFNNAATITALAGMFLLIIAEINPSWIGPLIASMAVVGIAVGLGAQDLVRDYFFGFVLLLENQYGIDNVVKLGDVSGLVERVTLRMTVLRDLDGVVHFVPHGQITTVTNMTHGWSRALFDVGVAYKENVDQVMDVLMQLGRELRNDPQFGPLILDDPEMLGVDKFDDSAVVIKFFMKTRPLQQFPVRRELNRRIKNEFDELGIEIPFPHRTIYHRSLTDDHQPLSYAEHS